MDVAFPLFTEKGRGSGGGVAKDWVPSGGWRIYLDLFDLAFSRVFFNIFTKISKNKLFRRLQNTVNNDILLHGLL